MKPRTAAWRRRQRRLGIAFFSSAISEDMVALIAELAPAIKIASGDLDFEPVIRAAAATGKPVILSTGAGTLDEIDRAVGWVRDEIGGADLAERLVLMQCVSAYPAPIEEASAAAVPFLRARYGVPVGYSNHVIGPEACYAAIALGAGTIEVHFTDRKEGRTFRDHALSFEPGELKDLVEKAARIRAAIGADAKAPQPSEPADVRIMRKGVVAARDLEPGTVLAREDLMFARPATEFAAGEIGALLGRKLTAPAQARRAHQARGGFGGLTAMCGIAGCIDKNAPPRERLAAAAHLLRHRGPDASGIWSRAGGTPAGRRSCTRGFPSSISTRAPISRSSGTIARSASTARSTITSNCAASSKPLGHRFVTQSDTEVIVHAWRQWGAGCFDRFEGMWALALADTRAGKLVLSRDRFGEKPLYLWPAEGRLLFASEIKALAALAGGWPDYDTDQLRRFLVNGYKALYKQPATFYRGVEELPAGSYLLVDCAAGKPLPRREAARALLVAGLCAAEDDRRRDGGGRARAARRARWSCGCAPTCRWRSA